MTRSKSADSGDESLSVAQAAATGNHRKLLVAMRDRIANAVSDSECPPRDIASLTRRLQDIAKEIEQIDLREKQENPRGDKSGDEVWDEASI